MNAYSGQPPAEYAMTQSDYLLSRAPNSMELLTVPVSSLKSLGLKKPIDIVAHWTICINGICYELARQTNKKEPYFYRCISLGEWKAKRISQGKPIESHELGQMTMPYSHQLIHEVATLVWERSLKKKYAYDDRNCQVFIRLLVELIGSPGARAEFPAFLDRWVKGAGNTRDGSFFAVAAAASTFAALGVGSLALDPTGITAAGFMLAVQTTLRSSTWLLTERHLKGEAIKDGQQEIRVEMKKRGRPLAET
ncbi:hypothetical protein KVR01_010146 [Diaporthe batatas]|uniref:uncharacterized protein n=1 Tax=Diaporthe batatas TaxID=748121 RepID=UPI001D0543AF|nr:uncharacterized protein KVR01_010146 [Diaporthe batatas]KAG8159509.1 hypothetical protein KVR01_010146 [Diaporthe batatas]